MSTEKEYLGLAGIYEKLMSGVTVSEIKKSYRTKRKDMEIAVGKYKNDMYVKINDYMRSHPDKRDDQVAKEMNISISELQKILGRDY